MKLEAVELLAMDEWATSSLRGECDVIIVNYNDGSEQAGGRRVFPTPRRAFMRAFTAFTAFNLFRQAHLWAQRFSAINLKNRQ